MEIYITRHTKPAVESNICYGQYDVALADSFNEDLEAIRNKLPVNFDAVYSSPLKRCTQLATGLGHQPLTEDLLMEMNFGDWENKAWETIDAQDLNNWMENFVHVKTPNGESLNELYERVDSFLTSLRTQSHQKVLLITHAGVIRCIFAYILEIPLKSIFKIGVGFNEVFKVKLGSAKINDQLLQP